MSRAQRITLSLMLAAMVVAAVGGVLCLVDCEPQPTVSEDGLHSVLVEK